MDSSILSCILSQEFAIDFPGIDLEQYYCNLWKGIKKYVLKDPKAETQELTEKETASAKIQWCSTRLWQYKLEYLFLKTWTQDSNSGDSDSDPLDSDSVLCDLEITAPWFSLWHTPRLSSRSLSIHPVYHPPQHTYFISFLMTYRSSCLSHPSDFQSLPALLERTRCPD